MVNLNKVAGKDAAVLKALPEIPLGISKWDMLLNGNYLIVDKTAKIADLVAKRLVFLARPRRMGKSTLCSMLYELFAHGKSNFAGKAIFDLWPEEDTYPVIRLSFNSIQCKDASEFETALKGILVKAFKQAGFPEVESFNQDELFSVFLENFSDVAQRHWLVFLIDEWDHQLSNSLDNEDDFNLFKTALSAFYSWLRNLPKLRFVFVTGIMRYRETSLFSGQDIQDLSMMPYFADLLGYTQDDIKNAFKDYIPLACQQMNLTEGELLHLLKVHYDGFCFDYNASVKVYCPYAINQFFSLVKYPDIMPYFGHYWMTSANASAALVSYLHRHNLPQDDLQQLCQQQFPLSYQEISEANFFGTVKFKQLLVQSGYFSIKSIAKDASAYDAREFTCGITNLEVSQVFVNVLTDYLLGFDGQKRSKMLEHSSDTQKDLLTGDIAHLCKNLNLMLCKIGYRILKDANEPLITCFFDVALSSGSTLITTMREEENNLGRSDLVADTKDRTYIFELKRLRKSTSSEEERRALLDEADQQMISRGYGSNRMQNGKPITGIALVICDEYRQICAWRTITLAGADTLKRKEGFIKPFNIETQLQLQQESQVMPVQSLPQWQWPQWPQVQQWLPAQQGLSVQLTWSQEHKDPQAPQKDN